MKKIALVGEYNADFPPHLATNAAIDHSNKFLGTNIKSNWISTEDLSLSMFDTYAGIWIAPGSPYKNMEKTLSMIKFARENDIPCFGTCGGFQHMILEYGRNVLGYKDAAHAEYDPYSSNLFISSLACSLFGRQMTINLKADSFVQKIYGNTQATENYYCNFGINPDVIPLFKNGPLQIVGSDAEGEVRVIEIPSNKFFVGTLFVPQNKSTEENPHQLISAFLRSI